MQGLPQFKDTKQKPASMPMLERSPSHSWWWDSHNSPKHSKWLQSNLQDLDEKVKEMLRLIQEDADSFAQRAEMYYKKRPELVNLVEEFYRAYRSLAERYDHLTGEIRQNVPRALQVQYGLSCDSPKAAHANGCGRHLSSPLRRSGHTFESLMKKACQSEDHQHERKEIYPIGDADAQGKRARDACIDEQDDGGLSSSASDSEVDDSTSPLSRLRREIDALKESNRVLTDAHRETLQLNAALLGKVKELEEGHRTKHEEADTLKCKVDADLQQPKNPAGDIHSIVLANDETGKELQVEILPDLDEEMDSCEGEEDTCFNYSEMPKGSDNFEREGDCIEHKGMQEEGGRALVDGLHYQIAQLKREVLERGEEKRSAIRQLCFSIDILKSNNGRLEVTLGLLKKQLIASRGGGAHTRAAAARPLPNPSWKQLFSMGEWRAVKRGATVAL